MLFDICVSSVFGGCNVSESLPLVKECGFSAYEFWSWWDQDVDAVLREQRRLSLECKALCTRFIPLNDPKRRGEFVSGLRETIAVAVKLDCGTIIAQVGQTIDGVPENEQIECVIDGLAECKPCLEASGRVLAIEPLNMVIDHPGYLLNSAQAAFDIVRHVECDNIKVLYDIYHQYVTEKSPLTVMTQNAALIAHIHLAGYPGRNEPWIDSLIDYKPMLEAMAQAGYAGSVGLEYYPKHDRSYDGLSNFLNSRKIT